MLTQESVYDRVVHIARGDLRDFFKLNFKLSEQDRFSLLGELRELDPSYFSCRFDQMTILDIAEDVITWLEETQTDPPRPPWVLHDLGLVKLSEDKIKISFFLNKLVWWINKLLAPGESLGVHLDRPVFPGYVWWEFRDLVGKRLVKDARYAQAEWKFDFHAATDQDKKFLGDFVSWLVLVRGDPTLHIIYNKEQILASSNAPVIQRARSRKILIHELGHARTRLTYYLQQSRLATTTTWIKSRPLYEYEAWLYALTIRSLLSCMRARLTRILTDGDYEWLTIV